MDKDYQLENPVTITDWLSISDFLPRDHNFDKLLKGFLETPGRIPQHSYNFYVSQSLPRFINILLHINHKYLCTCYFNVIGIELHVQLS